VDDRQIGELLTLLRIIADTQQKLLKLKADKLLFKTGELGKRDIASTWKQEL
jgi:hypothetical protein